MIKVNLLSPEKKEVASGGEATAFVSEERPKGINKGAILGAVLVTVAVIGFMYFSQASALSNTQRLLEEKKARKMELDEVLKTIDKLATTKTKLDKKVKTITELKAKQQDAVRMMDEVSKALPDMVWLTKLSFTDNVLKLEGSALTNDLIADFINSLKASNFFFNEQFDGSNRKLEGGIDIFSFKLTFQFKNTAEEKKKVI